MSGAAPESLLAQVLLSRLATQGRIRQLQLLVAINDQRSIARAAPRLNMSQPAATQALADLERLLGLPLFDRHARGMRATQAGRTLVAAARHVLAVLNDATQALSAITVGATAALRLGAIPAAASGLMPQLLNAFHIEHPDVHLEVIEGSGARLLPQLATGGLDAVFCRRPESLPPGFAFEPLLEDAVVLVAGADHPLADRRGLVLADLADARWVLPAAGTQLRELFDRIVLAELPQARWLRVSTLSVPVLAALLTQPGTVSLMPSSLAVTLRWSERVVQLDAVLPMCIDPLGIAYDQGRPFELLGKCVDIARRMAHGGAASACRSGSG